MARTTNTHSAVAYVVAALALVHAAPSHAYLDPGTGSIILQSVLAGIAVAMGLLRLYWQRFKSFLYSLKGGTGRASDGGERDFVPDTDTTSDS